MLCVGPDVTDQLTLSVLDTSPVASGQTPADALRNTLDVAALAERSGYTRYWVAEHYAMPGGASSAPAVLIAAIAAHTSRIRVGSGGVMLPNHAPLAVAEQFGTLEALHPGRIDLGLGRAPGSDQLTAYALRRLSAQPDGGDDFGPRLAELLAFFNADFPDDHPFARLQATPVRGYLPEVWLLGSSGFSAQLAGALGLPFAFANHFSGQNTDAAVALYRESFRPSPELAQPRLVVTTNAVAAPTAEQARRLASPMGLFFLRLRSGNPGPWPSEDETAAAAAGWGPAERAMVDERVASTVTGTPDQVVAQLAELAARTGADEIMVSTMTHRHEDRLRSYESVAQAAGLREPVTAVA